MPSFRVLEFSHGVAAAYCGKLLLEAGLEVVRGPARLREHLDLYLNAGKHLVNEEGARRLAPLADVVITDRAGEFGDVPGLVARVTPFGCSGPYASFEATDLVVEALGGLLYLIGTPDREPVKPHGYQASYLAGASTAAAVLAALYGGRFRGERIDVSMMETVASLLEQTLELPEYRGGVRKRCGSQLPESGPCTDIYRTRDGYASLAAQTIPQWQSLAAMIGRPELAEDPRFRTFSDQVRHAGELAPVLAEWFASKTTQEAFHEAQEWRIPVGPVTTIPELLNEPQLAAAGAWRVIEGIGIRIPGPSLRIDDSPSPELTLEPSRQVDAESIAARWEASRQAPPSTSKPRRGRARAGPLAGVRVLDLSAVWAGPLTGQLLGDLGAEVIKVEAAVRPDILRFSTRHRNGKGPPWNRGGWFHQVNRNKLGISLDLRSEEGRELLVELVKQSDVLVENYSRRVMENFGLPYERLSELNPRLVMISMPGFGDRGPYKDYVAFGEIIEAMGGLSSVTGYRNGPPLRAAIAFGDPCSGLHGTGALIAGLLRREETGKGCHIVLSHLQGIARCLGEEIVAIQQGRAPERMGNRDAGLTPQGVYPCRGEDRWLALSIRDDREWRALTRVLSDGALATDPRFTSWQARRRWHDEIDGRVSAATRHRDQMELMYALQTKGVPAGAVLDAGQLVADPHLNARGFFERVEQPQVGAVRLPGPMWHFGREPLRIRRPAPRLGEHTDEVLTRLLGLAAARLKELREAGVTSDEVPIAPGFGED